MNREAATPPRADRLRFVGQADLGATLEKLATPSRVTGGWLWTYLLVDVSPETEARRHALLRTLATDKERICEVK